MKPETNLFLRSLIGVKKSSLRRQIDEALDTPGFSKEDGNQLVAALKEISKCNDALTALRKESREQQPATPPLSQEVIEATRTALRNNLASMERSAHCLMGILALPYAHPGVVKDLADAQRLRDLAHRALDEFNAVYPEKSEKK